MRRKRIILLFLALVVVIVALGTLRQQKVYRAQTVLEVGVETPDITFYKEVYTTDPQNWWTIQTYYETQFKIIKSRYLMGVIADKIISEKIVENMNRDSIIGWLQGAVNVIPQEKSRLVIIAMDDTVPERAARISDLVAATYIEENLNRKIRGAKEAVAILSKQLDVFRQEKEKSELNVQKFKEENKIVSLESRQNVVKGNLISLNESLNRVKNERILLEARYRELKRIIGESPDPERLFGAVNSPHMNSLKIDYDDLVQKLGELSKRYREKHPEMVSLGAKREEILNSIKREAQAELKKLETDYLLASAQERSVMQNLEKQKGEALKIDALNIKLDTLVSAQSTNKSFYDGLTKKLKEADLTGLIKSNNIRIIDKALVPSSPIRPRVKSNILMAILFGLLGGIGVAYIIESMDNTIKTEDDVEKYSNIPLLGIIPFYDPKDKPLDKKDIELLPLKDSNSNVAEMYRTVRTNLTFLSSSKGYKVYQITSAGAKDGKTTTAVNLAISLAQYGIKTLLIDLDLRKSRVSSIFNIDKERGITDYLVGSISIWDAVKNTGIDNLDVLTTGTMPSNPAEIIGSAKLKPAFDELRKGYGMIIVDSSPIAPVTDSLIVAQMVDGVVFVVGAEKTGKGMLKNSKQQLVKVGANVLGAVFNGLNIEKKRYLGKYYSYGYYKYGYSYGHSYRPKGDDRTEVVTPGDDGKINA